MIFWYNNNMLHFFIHYGLHFLIFPGLVAFIASKYFNQSFKRVFIIMLLTMLVDIDHLFTDPIFDPNRCSVGFHFLHSYYAIAVYGISLFIKRTRIIAIGLLLHMLTDFIDCAM